MSGRVVLPSALLKLGAVCLEGVGLVVFLFPVVVVADCCEGWEERHPEWIWCDDFESTGALSDRYFEHQDDEGDFVVLDRVGRSGSRGLRARFQAGEVSAGSLKKSFGQTLNSYIGRHAARSSESFREVYWRFYFRRSADWKGGGGAKLSRATVFVAGEGWAQGMIAHLWSGGDENAFLLVDPASGIGTDGVLRSTRYNDFGNLRWLGYRQGKFPLFADEHAGKWFCIEAHVRLNRPGEKDGVFEYWINDQLQVRREELNWHGDWNRVPERPMINAIFLESYWNAGSPQLQERYFDDFVISTGRIGCECADEADAP